MSRTVKIENFLGMMPSSTKPPINAASLITNFDLRGKDGQLELRNGYDEVYAAFTHDYLTALTFWEFESLYVPDAGGGQEMFIVVGKGTLTPRSDAGGLSSNTILIILSTHTWNGSSWSEGYDWLNETVHTKIKTIDPDTVGDWEIELDFALGVGESISWEGWTVVNVSADPYSYAKVVKTGTSGAGNVKLFLTAEGHNWSVDDEIMIMKNYIPWIDMVNIPANITRKDVVFHRVMDDLRIGFGGENHRIGLAVGYRHYFLNVKGCDFVTYTSDELDAFAEYDGLMVTPHSAITEDAKFELSTLGSGSLTDDTYFMRKTAVLDDLSEIMLAADHSIILSGSKDLVYISKLKLGPENLRITKLKYYFAGSLKVFNYIHEETIRNRTGRIAKFNIDVNGYLTLADDTTQRHDENQNQNAANLDLLTDPLLTTGWTVETPTAISAAADAGGGSINVLKLTKPGNLPEYLQVYYNIADLANYTVYDVTLKMKAVVPTTASVEFWFDTNQVFGDGPEKHTIEITNAYAQYTFELKTLTDANAIFMKVINIGSGGGQDIRFDVLSIIKKSFYKVTSTFPERGSEISAELGYTPTLNVIKGWDNAIVTQGRTFLIGAYIDKRYINKIFFSAISGAAANMYDALTSDSLHYYDLENFDGGELMKLEVLPNLDFLGLKSNGPMRINSFTGSGKDVEYGAGLRTKKGVINLGRSVLYPGEYDIIEANGIQTRNISDGSIRELYRALTSTFKDNMIATREEKDNAYRLFTGDTTNKTEYILTKKGWIAAQRIKYPEAYTINRSGDVLFMNTGVIYKDSATNKLDKDQPIIARWNSVYIDGDLLGLGLEIDEIMLLEGIYLFYSSSQQIKIYISYDYENGISETITLPAGDYLKKGKPLKEPKSCRALYFQVVFTYALTDDYCNINGIYLQVGKTKMVRSGKDAV